VSTASFGGGRFCCGRQIGSESGTCLQEGWWMQVVAHCVVLDLTVVFAGCLHCFVAHCVCSRVTFWCGGGGGWR
jgi:hypothetical protein